MTESSSHVPGSVRSEVLRLIRLHVDSTWTDEELRDEVDILADGLGCDSVRLVELMLACEDTFQIHLSAEDVAGDSLTVGRFVGLVQRAVADSKANGGS